MKKLIIKIIKFLEKIGLYDSKDVNHDGKINSQDYVVIKKHIMKKESEKQWKK